MTIARAKRTKKNDMGRKAKSSWWTPAKLTKAREALGLTKEELGKALDITYRQIHNFEEGDSPIPRWIVIILKAAEAGQIDLRS